MDTIKVNLKTALLTDQELELWLESRLGKDSKFNRQFARDLCEVQVKKVLSYLKTFPFAISDEE